MTAAFGEAIAAAAEAFGPAASEAAWGEGEAVVAEESNAVEDFAHAMHKIKQVQHLADGSELTLDPDAIKNVLWSPAMIAALTEAGQKVVDAANSMAQIEGAEYMLIVQKDESYPMPRVLVVASNYKAKLDEAHHSTMERAMVAAGGGVDASVIPVTW